MGLFLSQGFEATTVEDIGKAAGISRRSYFRYFGSKDEAFIEGLASFGDAIAETLTDRPPDESPWLALRRAFDHLLEQAQVATNPEALGRLMLERPTLQQGKDAVWQKQIAAALLPRLSGNKAEEALLSAHALAAAAISCLHVAQAQWLAPEERRPLTALLDTAMAAVHPLS